MKKFAAIFTICAVLSGTLHAQSTGEELRQIDNAVKTLSTELAKTLAEQRAATVVVSQFVYMGGTSQFNAYLSNQLAGELLDARGRSFTLVAGGGAQWIISGEIVRINDLIRIYSRLVRREDNALVAQTRTDLEINRSISAMLSSGSDGDSSVFVMADDRETDSWDAPVVYSVETDANAVPMQRTLQDDDHDWFVIEPDGAMSLVIETTGNTDTFMTLYDADTREVLASNDDGDDLNAMIRHSVRPGKRYMVEVRGYSSDTIGEYGFRAVGRAEE